MINTFSDPIIPQGGMIRETLGWQANVSSGTHSFTVASFYGAGTTVETVLANVLASKYLVIGPVASSSIVTNLDTAITSSMPSGTYSCATIICESIVGTTINGIYATKFDSNVLTIVPAYSASIISTSFALY